MSSRIETIDSQTKNVSFEQNRICPSCNEHCSLFSLNGLEHTLIVIGQRTSRYSTRDIDYTYIETRVRFFHFREHRFI
jgi:hypothetical protein